MSDAPCEVTGAGMTDRTAFRTDIEGLSSLVAQRIPNYLNVMNSYAALTTAQK